METKKSYRVSLDMSGADTFKTLPEAYAAARADINRGTVTDATIALMSGTHRLSEALTINGGEYQSGASLTFLGEKDGSTVLTVTKEIPATAFTPVPGTPYSIYRLTESDKQNGALPAFRDLYLDGKPMKMARSASFQIPFDTCRNAAKYGVSIDDRLLYVAKETLDGIEWDKDTGMVKGTIEFWLQMDWQIHAVHIERVIEKPEVSLGEELYALVVKENEWEHFRGASDGNGKQAGYFYPLENRPFWFANNKAFIKNPGEFVYADGAIYAYLPEGAKTVSYPQCENIFTLKDVANIHFQNLTLWGTTANHITENGYVTGQGGYIKMFKKGVRQPQSFLKSGAIYGENAKNITAEDCFFYSVGGDAISLRGAIEQISITGSRFLDVGGTAIRIGNCTPTYDETIYNKDIVIRENHIQNTGWVYNSNTAILIASVRNLDISHNTILDSAYSAISVGWSWGSLENDPDEKVNVDSFVNIKNASIAYNYIENFMTDMQDGGAIYVLGGNANGSYMPYINSMNNNYVVLTEKTGHGSGHWTVYYHDSGSSHWDDYNNALIIDPKAILTHHTYVSYQVRAQAYHNLTRDMHYIGYRPDYKIGWIGNEDKEKTEEEWKAYAPDWYSDISNNWYQEWIVEGKRPPIPSFGWLFAVSGRNISKESRNTFRYEIREDGAYTIHHPDIDTPKNRVEDIHIYEGFEDAKGTKTEAFLKELVKKAGCASHHPKYGTYTAR